MSRTPPGDSPRLAFSRQLSGVHEFPPSLSAARGGSSQGTLLGARDDLSWPSESCIDQFAHATGDDSIAGEIVTWVVALVRRRCCECGLWEDVVADISQATVLTMWANRGLATSTQAFESLFAKALRKARRDARRLHAVGPGRRVPLFVAEHETAHAGFRLTHEADRGNGGGAPHDARATLAHNFLATCVHEMPPTLAGTIARQVDWDMALLVSPNRDTEKSRRRRARAFIRARRAAYEARVKEVEKRASVVVAARGRR